MRPIILFALFALAVNASFNLTEYQLGFVEGLNFTPNQIKDSFTCINALKTAYGEISHLIKSKQFTTITNMTTEYKDSILTACGAYLLDLLQYFEAESNIGDLHQIIKANWDHNYPTIVQAFDEVFRNVIEGNYYQAGMAQAYILELFIDDRTAYYNDTDSSDSDSAAVPFNATEFFSVFYPAVFEVLGIQAEPNVTALTQCYEDVRNLTLEVMEMKNNFSNYSPEEKIGAMLSLSELGISMWKNCESAEKTEMLVLGPIVKYYKKDPKSFLVNVADRVGYHFTDIVTLYKKQMDEIKRGDYEDAGWNEGDILTFIFTGYVDFASSS